MRVNGFSARARQARGGPLDQPRYAEPQAALLRDAAGPYNSGTRAVRVSPSGVEHLMPDTQLVSCTVAEALEAGAAEPGLDAAGVIEALREQTDALDDSLTADNVADHIDLPENAQVESVRRLRGAAGHFAYDLTDLMN